MKKFLRMLRRHKLFRVSEHDCINDIQMFYWNIDDELCSRRDRFLRSLANSTNTVISFCVVCPFRSMSSFRCNFFCVVFVYCALLLLSVIDE